MIDVVAASTSSEILTSIVLSLYTIIFAAVVKSETSGLIAPIITEIS